MLIALAALSPHTHERKRVDPIAEKSDFPAGISKPIFPIKLCTFWICAVLTSADLISHQTMMQVSSDSQALAV
jgi:hypothetical protein